MNSVSNFVREIMSKKSKKEEDQVVAPAEEEGLSPEGKPLDEVADIVITHPEEAALESVPAEEVTPAVAEEEAPAVEDTLPPCGSELCSEGVCQNASAFVSKFFSYKYEIVNLSPKQISLLSCALKIEYSGGETHIDKVGRIVEALGIEE